MKLNLGCGSERLPGWVNVDKGNCDYDVNHDLEIFPYPFEDNSVEAIRMHHVLEHLNRENLPRLIAEFKRICINGAMIYIESPHGLSNNFVTDFTHKLPLTERSLDYWDKTKPLGVNGAIYGLDQCLKIIVAKLNENWPNGPDVIIHAQVIK